MQALPIFLNRLWARESLPLRQIQSIDLRCWSIISLVPLFIHDLSWSKATFVKGRNEVEHSSSWSWVLFIEYLTYKPRMLGRHQKSKIQKNQRGSMSIRKQWWSRRGSRIEKEVDDPLQLVHLGLGVPWEDARGKTTRTANIIDAIIRNT